MIIMNVNKSSSSFWSDAFVIKSLTMNSSNSSIRRKRRMQELKRVQQKSSTMIRSTSSSLHMSSSSTTEMKVVKPVTNQQQEEEESSKKTDRSSSVTSFSYNSMLNHKLLTKEEDLQLGQYVQRANAMQSVVEELLLEKKQREQQQQQQQQEMITADGDFISEDVLYARGNMDGMEMEEELHHLSIYSKSSVESTVFSEEDHSYFSEEEMENDDDEDFGLFSKVDELEGQHQLMENRKWLGGRTSFESKKASSSEKKKKKKKEKTADKETKDKNSNIPLLDVMDQLECLSEDEIVSKLQIPGGRTELKRIFVRGALAKNELIRCNIKLVVSIAKRWSKNGASPEQRRLNAATPLEEAMQEGILGLAQAAERYDPERKLRFSTYATFYITNRVRICYRTNSVGSMKVPAHYHDIVAKYYKLRKEDEQLTQGLPSPTATGKQDAKSSKDKEETTTILSKEEEMAMKIGITLRTLRNALKYTQPITSLDTPVSSSFIGQNTVIDGGIIQSSISAPAVSELLPSTMGFIANNHNQPSYYDHMTPKDHVELSLLRQCLENAMATQLSPHERDVIRLRLGLDDGVSRTVKEVANLCGSTNNDINSAEKRAYSKLHSPYGLYTNQLLSFLDLFGIDVNNGSRR